MCPAGSSLLPGLKQDAGPCLPPHTSGSPFQLSPLIGQDQTVHILMFSMYLNCFSYVIFTSCLVTCLSGVTSQCL
jgi:hypothetical protein